MRARAKSDDQIVSIIQYKGINSAKSVQSQFLSPRILIRLFCIILQSFQEFPLLSQIFRH